MSESVLNDLNRSFHTRLLARSDIYLTPTVLNGTYCLRMPMHSLRTGKEHIERAFEILKEEASAAVSDYVQRVARRVGGGTRAEV